MKNKLDLDLEGQDSNAFSLLGHFSREAKRAGWTPKEIADTWKEATSRNYDHLLQTLLKA